MTINFHLFLIVLCIAYSIGDPLCGPESCNDLNTVKACKNVKYCISDVWSKKVYSGSRDRVCDICLEMVKEARDQLESNETMTELKEVLEGSCSLLMVKPAVKICKKLADEFVPELVEILASQMDPEAVCSVAKLCNNPELREEQIKSNECVTCQQFITLAGDFVTRSPKQELMNQYVKVCRSMGSYSDSCILSLIQDPSAVVGRTKDALSQRPCEMARLCPEGSTPSTSVASGSWKESREKLCFLCPGVLKSLRETFEDMKTEDELKDWTLRLCTSLSLAETACSEVVERHRMIYSYFRSGMSNDYICGQAFGFCDSQDSEQAPVWPLLPVDIESGENLKKLGRIAIGEDSMIKIKTNRIELSVGDPLPEPFISLPANLFTGGSAEECQACTDVFSKVSSYLITHQDYVDSMLNETCAGLKDHDKCVKFTEKYGNLFTESTHIVPEKICPALVPFCDGKPLADAFLAEMVSKETRNAKRSCDFCVDLFDSLKDGSKVNAAELQVNSDLKETCKRAPAEEMEICLEIAENFLKNVIASVTSESGTVEACDRLELCESQREVPEIPKSSSESSCKTCMLVVQTLYDELKDKSSEEEIKKLLEEVCEKFSSSEKKAACDFFVEKYSNELIGFIMDNLGPEVICQKLRYCHSGNGELHRVILQSDNRLEVVGNRNSKVPCNLCLTVIKMLLDQLKNNKTEEEIKNTLDRICTYMPEEVRDSCNSIINRYADDIVDMVIADLNATEICTYLKLCGPNGKAKERISSSFIEGFSVATNEIWRKKNPKGACHFCRLMERSMAVKGYEDKGAEGMLGLLTDLCIMDVDNLYGNCAKKLTEEIFPFGKRALLEMSEVCSKMEICPEENWSGSTSGEKVFARIRAAVQECAMCETVVGIVSWHLKMNAGKYDFAGNASRLCSSVPNDKIQMCKSMLTSYAPSVVNLLTEMNVRPDDVCFRLQLCDKSDQTKVDMPVTSLEQSGLVRDHLLGESGGCLDGPSFWCANLENAKKCGTLPHCREIVWKGATPSN